MILILGENGQLARSLNGQAWGATPVRSVSSKELDLREPEKVRARLDQIAKTNPSLIINAMAYTAVDKAETESDVAFAVNSSSVAEIGLWAKSRDCNLIHFSTDYVYEGQGDTPQTELTPLRPQNVYGRSKLAGEEALTKTNAAFLVLRVSWLFSPFGHNFVKTMLRLGQTQSELKVVADQVGSPMAATAVAELVQRRLSRLSVEEFKRTAGVYNLSSSPFCSWAEFAKAIFAQSRELGLPLQVQSVLEVASSEYKTAARRPLNSRLDDSRFRNIFQDQLEDWPISLQKVLRSLHANH